MSDAKFFKHIFYGWKNVENTYLLDETILLPRRSNMLQSRPWGSSGSLLRG